MKKSEIIECNGVSYKNCPHCGRVLPVNCFSKSNTSASGYRSWCKECINTSRNTEENKAKCRNYYNSRGRELSRIAKEHNIQKYLYTSAKARARQRGETFTIDIEDIVVPEVCPILGIPLKYNRGMKGDDSYSLDRIDSSRGYVKGNIWVISLRANRIKNDSTVEGLRLIADKVEQKLKEAR